MMTRPIDEITKILGDMDTVVLAASMDSASKSDCISLGKGSIANQCSLIAGFIRASSEHMAKDASEDPAVISAAMMAKIIKCLRSETNTEAIKV